MSNLTLRPLVSSFILAATMIVAGVTSTFLPPGKTLCTTILHFAGGMIFGIVARELWPFVSDRHLRFAEGMAFILGFVILLGLRWLTHNAVWKSERSLSANPLPLAVLIETGENMVVDGLVIGVAFAAATKVGVLLTLTLAIEALSLGIPAASRSEKSSRAGRIALIFFLGSGYVIASGVASSPLRHLSDEGVSIALSFELGGPLISRRGGNPDGSPRD